MIHADSYRKSFDQERVFFAVQLLRTASIVMIIFTLPVRGALPEYMFLWFQRLSIPLLVLNLALLIFYKKAASFLTRNIHVLLLDLAIAVGILQIGGGWRSSYFEYTLTTIMVFTLFDGNRGAIVSSAVLAAAAMIKDPSGGLPSFAIFDVSNWDMRIGASLFYVTAGFIIGYFNSLMRRLEKISEERILETKRITAMEEKNRIALELHDGSKQMVAAMILRLSPVVKKLRSNDDTLASEVRWLWRGLNYLRADLAKVMTALRQTGDRSGERTSLNSILLDEVKIMEDMTGFSWDLSAASHDLSISDHHELPLRRFLGEALMNSWKHSGAMNGSIVVKHADKTTTIIIRDNGNGFEYPGTDGTDSELLKSLLSRVEELKGDFRVETSPGNGCTLALTLSSCDR